MDWGVVATNVATALGGAVAAWLALRRQLSTDSVQAKEDDAGKGYISRIERANEELQADNDKLRAQVQQLIESKATDAGVASAKTARLEAQIAELSAKRDQWQSAYRRLAEEADPRFVALTAPTGFMGLDEAKEPPR